MTSSPWPQRALWSLLVAALAVFVAHRTVGFGDQHALIDDGVYHGLLGVSALIVLVRAARVREDRAAWALIGLGMTTWWLADLYNSFVLVKLAEPPYPSISDFGWLLFYPTCYAGVALLLRRRGTGSHNLTLDGLLAALAAGAVVTAVVFEPILAMSLEGSSAAVAVNLAYPVGDVLLLALLIGAAGLLGWRLGAVWIFLGLGLVLSGVADLVYLTSTANGSFDEHGLVGSLWPAAALSMAFASTRRTLVENRARIEGLRLLIAPTVFTLAAFAILIYDHFIRVSDLSLFLAGAALLVGFVRTWLSFRWQLAILGRSRVEARSDVLTGLGNRRALTHDLAAAVRACGPQRPLLLLLFDLNGFKTYNDVYGHPAGDALLARLGRGLADAVAGGGAAYRMGGDEFCVLAPLEAGDTGTAVTAACLVALNERGDGFTITAAHGSQVLACPDTDVEDALRAADRRMYVDKASDRLSAGGQSAEVLVRLLAERDDVLGEHVDDVAQLCERVALALGLPDDERIAVVRAGVLHDIGKAAIPDAILSKAARLDEEEWVFMRRHTIIGERILLGAPALGDVAKLVRSSHERVDGTGYPDGLVGEEIPLGARIIAVCDAYDAMTSDRPYQAAMTPDMALAELVSCAGRQFDATVVEAFCSSHVAVSSSYA